MDEEKQKRAAYLERLTELLGRCLIEESSTLHGLLIIANDSNETLALYSINLNEEEMVPLVTAAQRIVASHLEVHDDRTLN